MSFTLAGKQIARVLASRPRYGVASAEVELDGAYDVKGNATLVLGDLSMEGVIWRGGVANGVGRYEWLAGKGLWDLRLPPDGNRQSALGVRRSTVIDKIVSDMELTAGVAKGAAERVVNDLPELRLKPGWSRATGSGREALAALGVPFWVAPDGRTLLGTRSIGEVASDATILDPRPEMDATSLMPMGEQIAAWAPGATLAGRRIGHVSIHANREQPIKIVLTYEGATDRDHLNAIIGAETSKLRYLGPYTYRVRSRDGTAYGLTPDRDDMPVLDGVEIWGGLAGHSADLKTGSRVVVNFLDGDPARYVIVGFTPSYGSGGEPEETRIDGDIVRVNKGTLPVHRQTDGLRVYGLQFVTTQVAPTSFGVGQVDKFGFPVGAVSIVTLGIDRITTVTSLNGEAIGGAEDFLA